MTPGRAVWAGSAAFALAYALLGWNRYATFHSGADLGLFTQAIASAFHGFASTLEGGSHFTYHFSPVLYVLAPLLWIARTPLALVAVQACAGALVAPGLFALARRRVDDRTALSIAAIAWIYPPLAGVVFTDFHENGLVPAATVWLLWALDTRRVPAACALAALLLATKEDQAVVLGALGAGLGVVGALRHRRDVLVAGATLALAAGATFGAYFMLVRGLAGAQSAWDPLHFYALGGAATRGPTAPLFSFGRLTYLLEAFAPLAFLPLFSAMILAALPGLAECLLSRESLTYTMGQHYAAVWIGYALGAYVLAACALVRARPVRAKFAIRAAAAVSLLVLAAASPTHWGHFLRARSAHDAVLDRFIAAIPFRASVGTHDELYAHLGFVPRAQIGLDGEPDLLLFDDAYRSTAWTEHVRPRFEALLAAHAYRIVRREDGVTLAARTR